MNEILNQSQPEAYPAILEATEASGFTMASDRSVGCLLRTLARSKPGGQFLELGTGTGLSTSWILDGMDASAALISIDHDPKLLDIAGRFLGNDHRLTLLNSDGEQWVEQNLNKRFDYIFADTWHGKYLLLEEVLNMLNPGGFYLIDDMLPQPNWPEGHAEKAKDLVTTLEQNDHLFVSKQVWATGIILAVRK